MSRYYECANCPNLPNCTNSTTHEYCSKFWVVHSTTGGAGMTKKEALELLYKLEFMDHDYKDILDVVDEIETEPDCCNCKHYRFGKDGRDITCNDCKWNYNDMFEEQK